MKTRLYACVVGAALAMPIPVFADPPTVGGPAAGAATQSNLVQRITPSAFVDFLQQQGYRAKLVKKPDETYVLTNVVGFDTYVFFYGCNESGCTSIEFAVIAKVDSVTPAFANEWNLKWRYTKLAVNKNGVFAFTMDVVLNNGVTTGNLEAQLRIFEDALNTLKRG